MTADLDGAGLLSIDKVDATTNSLEVFNVAQSRAILQLDGTRRHAAVERSLVHTVEDVVGACGDIWYRVVLHVVRYDVGNVGIARFVMSERMSGWVCN